MSPSTSQRAPLKLRSASSPALSELGFALYESSTRKAPFIAGLSSRRPATARIAPRPATMSSSAAPAAAPPRQRPAHCAGCGVRRAPSVAVRVPPGVTRSKSIRKPPCRLAAVHFVRREIRRLLEAEREAPSRSNGSRATWRRSLSSALMTAMPSARQRRETSRLCRCATPSRLPKPSRCAAPALVTRPIVGSAMSGQVLDLAAMIRAHLDDGIAMRRIQLEQHERHADVIVQLPRVTSVGPRRERMAPMHFLRRGLAIAAGDADDRNTELRAAMRAQTPTSAASGSADNDLRNRDRQRLFARAPPPHHVPRPCAT